MLAYLFAYIVFHIIMGFSISTYLCIEDRTFNPAHAFAVVLFWPIMILVIAPIMIGEKVRERAERKRKEKKDADIRRADTPGDQPHP